MSDKSKSLDWWNSIKSDPTKFENWLRKQYHGENRAAAQLNLLLKKFGKTLPVWERRAIATIAEQESRHAGWINALLARRTIFTVAPHSDRYWKETLKWKNFKEAAAVAFHAETMRLERIRVIAEDKTAPWDVKETFVAILKDEEFHAKAFEKMSTPETRKKALKGHRKGREALGLNP